MSSFPTGIREVDRLIALEVPDSDMPSLCQVDPTLCQDPEFWRLRILKYFPGVVPQLPYREHYRRLYSLSYNGILLVQDGCMFYVAHRISEIHLLGMDLKAIIKEHDLSTVPVYNSITVHYIRYGQVANKSTLILSVDPFYGNTDFFWNEVLWNELMPITIHPSLDLVIFFIWMGNVKETRLYHHFTPELKEQLLTEAEEKYIKTERICWFYLMTPQRLVKYLYDHESNTFKIRVD